MALERLDLLLALEGAGVDHGHRNEDHLFVEAREVPQDRQQRVHPEAAVGADEQHRRGRLRVAGSGVWLAPVGQGAEDVVELPQAFGGPLVVRLDGVAEHHEEPR